jgi:NAD-dependent deacetylase
MKNLVVLTGAGMSAESGLRTFRDGDGLWEEYNVYDVATSDAWAKNPALVLRFYNQRRLQLAQVKPNEGHYALQKLEAYFKIDIITQNVDDLHERAGSSHVLHLHGELNKARGVNYPDIYFDVIAKEINLGDLCPKGSQLRPHVVWFGEEVPLLDEAEILVKKADVLLIIGTSLNVYPAAGLLHAAKANTPIYVLDPKAVPAGKRAIYIQDTAANGMKTVTEMLLRAFAE